MLFGLFNHRTGDRMPFEANLNLKLEQDERELKNATIVNIGAGGLEFLIIYEKENELAKGDLAWFYFNLPDLGEVEAKGQIVHSRYGVNQHKDRCIFYGVKFLDISIDAWNYIVDYCSSKKAQLNQEVSFEKMESISKQKTPPRQESGPIVTIPNLNASIQQKDGKILEGKVEGISLGGLRIYLPVNLPINSNNTLRLNYHDKTVYTVAKAAWSVPVKNEYKNYLNGLLFYRFNEEQLDLVKTIMNDLLYDKV